MQFVIDIPPDFGRRLIRGEKPAILLIADATDPTATAGAIAAVTGAVNGAFDRELTGPLAHLAQGAAPYELRIQRRYNPAGETRRNIVPGLIGTILTMTMLIYTGLSVTREIERGTMEVAARHACAADGNHARQNFALRRRRRSANGDHI